MTKIVTCYFCGLRTHADNCIHEPYSCMTCGPQQFYIGLKERDKLLRRNQLDFKNHSI